MKTAPLRSEARRINHMSRLRCCFLWLVMAAIPMQGFAATAMLFCKGGLQGAAQKQGQVGAHASHPTDHHATAPATHDHSQHGHAGLPEAQQGDSTSVSSDVLAKCSVCASCCSGAAIAEWPRATAFGIGAQAKLAEPLVLIHARPAPVPDKPPRA